VVRHEAEEATVEALFDQPPQDVRERLEASGIEPGEDLVIKRVVSRAGKNRNYISGSLCPLGLLTEIGVDLVHVYGQHEQQTLRNPETHLALLDAFGGLEAKALAGREKFRALGAAWHALREARELAARRNRERGLLEAQAAEIGALRLRPHEEQELQVKRNILANAEKLYQGCREGEDLLYEGDDAVAGRLGRYALRLRELARIDAGLGGALELLESAAAQLEEANAELRRYAERADVEPGALEQLENRLGAIDRLKRKYNASAEELLDLQAQAESELQALDRSDETIPGLERAYESALDEAWNAAEALSEERRRTARRFQKEIEKELKALGMGRIIFDIRFAEPTAKDDEPPYFRAGRELTDSGIDQVEFLFSPNPGEPPKPLAKTASGGELSRVMLAIKASVLAPGRIPTVLFDEVDAGIGGGTAEIVGNKLKEVAARHQVICVTHLPQIAALADTHHAVRKEVVKGRTSTRVVRLTESERIDEIARMLGGVKITDNTRRHAEEMVRRSK
jgi:DNA repair protein RecN (Recombination protein N)